MSGTESQKDLSFPLASSEGKVPFQLSQHQLVDNKPLKPSVYQFTDYRKFLQASLDFKRKQNPQFSESAFLRQAGFGENSRGYFGLIMAEKRNLSHQTIVGFSRACRLNEIETSYFEALVHYNQAKTDKDKTYYFERMTKLQRGKTSEAFELLKSQYEYFSNWSLVAIRELVSFNDFQENAEWISVRLRKRVTSKQVTEAIEHLLRLQLLVRNENGQLALSNSIVTFTDNSMNYTTVNQVHAQVLDLAKHALEHDSYKDRSISSVVLACDENRFDEIRAEINNFRNHILKTYGEKTAKTDAVLNIGIQLFHLTQIKKGAHNNA